MRSPSRGSTVLAALFVVTVAGVPYLRPEDETAKRPPKVIRATSRPAPPSSKVEVPLVGGVEVETHAHGGREPLTRERRSFFASIGVVARYDEWLSPPPSTAEVAKVGRGDGVIDANSRDVEADGSPRVASGEPGAESTTDPIIDALRADPRAEALLTSGVDALRRGDFPRAFDELRRGSLLAKDSGLARHTFAVAQFALGDYDGAAASLRRAVEAMPELPKLGLDIAALYEPASRDLADQRLALESHARLRPADRNAALVAAWIALGCGETERARAGFAALLESDPRDLVARAYLESLDP